MIINLHFDLNSLLSSIARFLSLSLSHTLARSYFIALFGVSHFVTISVAVDVVCSKSERACVRVSVSFHQYHIRVLRIICGPSFTPAALNLPTLKIHYENHFGCA